MILGNTPDKVSSVKSCPVCNNKMRRVMRDETTTGFIPGFSWDWNCPQCNHNEKGDRWNEEGDETSIINHWKDIFSKE